MSITSDMIRGGLAPTAETTRKQIAFSIEDEKLRRLDSIARTMAAVSGQTKTRNMVLDMAIDAFIAEAMSAFEEEGIPILDEIPAPNFYDTVVLPGRPNGFKEAFLGERKWYYARIAEQKIPQIKYLAIYVGAPLSRITHYVAVNERNFVYNAAEGKYIIEFDREPVALDNPVPLGDVSGAATRVAKYTTLERLMSAKEFKEL